VECVLSDVSAANSRRCSDRRNSGAQPGMRERTADVPNTHLAMPSGGLGGYQQPLTHVYPYRGLGGTYEATGGGGGAYTAAGAAGSPNPTPTNTRGTAIIVVAAKNRS
jgi:hypothetical protein